MVALRRAGLYCLTFQSVCSNRLLEKNVLTFTVTTWSHFVAFTTVQYSTEKASLNVCTDGIVLTDISILCTLINICKTITWHDNTSMMRKLECAHFSQILFWSLVTYRYHHFHAICFFAFRKCHWFPCDTLPWNKLSGPRNKPCSWGWFLMVDHSSQPMVNQPGFESKLSTFS